MGLGASLLIEEGDGMRSLLLGCLRLVTLPACKLLGLLEVRSFLVVLSVVGGLSVLLFHELLLLLFKELSLEVLHLFFLGSLCGKGSARYNGYIELTIQASSPAVMPGTFFDIWITTHCSAIVCQPCHLYGVMYNIQMPCFDLSLSSVLCDSRMMVILSK